MEWRIKELEEHVSKSNGDDYSDNIHEPLQSFHFKSLMARYHATESDRIINDMLSSTDGITNNTPDAIAFAKAILIASSEGNEGNHIIEAQFKAEAHIIASAQAIHSLFDVMAFIIFWTFKLDSITSIPENKINLFCIKNALNGFKQFSKTYILIDKLLSSSEYEYLDAFVNTTKHKRLIPSKLSASFGVDENGGIQILGFSYKKHRNKKSFSKKWSKDFLESDNETLRLRLMEVGISLNEYFNK